MQLSRGPPEEWDEEWDRYKWEREKRESEGSRASV